MKPGEREGSEDPEEKVIKVLEKIDEKLSQLDSALSGS
jgi:hypothetical protein